MKTQFVVSSLKSLVEYENKINSLKKYENNNVKIKTTIIDANIYNNKMDYSNIDYSKVDLSDLDKIGEHAEKLKGIGKRNMEITKTLFKDSYIIVDKPILVETLNNGKKIENSEKNRKNIDSVVTFFSNKHLTEFIPSSMFEFNNLHIVYSDMLFFYRHKTMINFSLFRLKFNNTMRLLVSKNKDGEVSSEMNNKCPENNKNNQNKKCELIKIPIEIVDLSVLSIDDNRQDFDYLFFQKKENGEIDKYTKIEYSIDDNLSDDTRKNKSTKSTKLTFNVDTYIPSANYMFYDIAEMLFADNMFIWEDKKYEKRIRRLMYLSMICELSNKKPINALLSEYQEFNALFVNFNRILGEFIQRSEKTNFIEQIYEKIKNDKENPMIIKSNEQMITRDINNLRETKLMALKEKKINFFIDKFISNYYETIILIKYFKDTYASVLTTSSKLSDEHFEYCKYQNELLELIKNKKIVKHRMVDGNEYNAGVDYNGIDEYKTQDAINEMMKKLHEYHDEIIKHTGEIIRILNNMLKQNIQKINKFDLSANCLN